MPAIAPATSARNRTPSSYAPVSAFESVVGAVLPKIVHGQGDGPAVVNVQVTSEPSGFPARSVAVPFSVAVYVVAAASGAVGVSVVTFVFVETVAGTVAPVPSFSVRLIDAGAIASLKRAWTVAVVSTAVPVGVVEE